MIKVLEVQGHFRPFLSCDRCNKQIGRPEDGLAIFNPVVLKAAVFSVHKGDCHKGLQDAMGGRLVEEQALRKHLLLLAVDNGIVAEDLKDLHLECGS